MRQVVPWMKLLLCVCVALLLTGSKPVRERVEYRVIERDEISQHRARGPVVKVFEEPGVYSSFYRYVKGHRLSRKGIPTVDFSDRMVVYLSLGEKTESGYRIEVGRVYLQSARIFIQTIVVKDPGRRTPTNPYVMITVPRSPVRWIEWIDFSGRTIERERMFPEIVGRAR